MPSRRSSISNGTKQEVITWIDTQGEGVPTRAVAQFRQQGLNLDSGTVRKWWRKRTEILAAPPHLMRVEGGGRSRALWTLEDDLLDAIIDRRLRTSGSGLRKKRETSLKTWGLAVRGLLRPQHG
ncbi:unnamed protein product [Phytophthora lilii]|uniref:Unnamed protein product n=1 Tax=Phytophthora lilii TaxID=2077276 RepID=A0A9W6U8W5_9STRA|nr:unnamed protein product [Phytophthora lilii]